MDSVLIDLHGFIIVVGNNGAIDALTSLTETILVIGELAIGITSALLFKEENFDSDWRSNRSIGSMSMGV